MKAGSQDLLGKDTSHTVLLIKIILNNFWVENQHNHSTPKFGSLLLYSSAIGIWAAKPECIYSDRHHQLDV